MKFQVKKIVIRRNRTFQLTSSILDKTYFGEEITKQNESNFNNFILQAHLMVFPVLSLTHWGMGLFCFIFLPKILLILKLLWDG